MARAQFYPNPHEIKVLRHRPHNYYLAECEGLTQEVGQGDTPMEALLDFIAKIEDDYVNVKQAIGSHQTPTTVGDREYLETLRGFLTGSWEPMPSQRVCGQHVLPEDTEAIHAMVQRAAGQAQERINAHHERSTHEDPHA